MKSLYDLPNTHPVWVGIRFFFWIIFPIAFWSAVGVWVMP